MKPSVPPVVVFLVHFCLVWLINKYLYFAKFTFIGQRAVTLILIIAGIAIALIAIYTMYKAKTTIDPVVPNQASSLVSTSIFRISRNPMYLALLLILIAWIVWKGSLMAMFLPVTFVWYMTHFQIRAEEKALEGNFGEQYREYRLKVRRWI